jgi:peptidoglycan hydrolase CwlO-like protein
MSIRERQRIILEKGAASATKWIGSAASVSFHTIAFIIAFALPLLHVVTFDRMLLVLTTMVSLEAIYLSIFIQMSINMNNQNIEIIQGDIEELGEELEELGEDIEEIQKDVDELGEDIEELGEDIEELGEDIEEIGEDIEEMQKDVEELGDDLEELGEDLEEINEDLEIIQKEVDEIQEEIEEDDDHLPDANTGSERELLLSIQATLAALQKEIEQLKSR